MEKLIALMHIINEGWSGEYVNENGLDPCTHRLVQMFRLMLSKQISKGMTLENALIELNATLKPKNLITTNLQCEYSPKQLSVIDFDAYSKWVILQAASKVKGVDQIALLTAGMWFVPL